jgi:hypothetical protein
MKPTYLKGLRDVELISIGEVHIWFASVVLWLPDLNEAKN